MTVPTKIFIWVTPDEKILGNSFLKKILVFLSILISSLILGEKYFFINKYKNINCNIPDMVTA